MKIGSFNLLRGDCMELLRKVEDSSVDLVLCDMPYGTTQNKWDSVLPLPELWDQYWRVCKPSAAVVLTCAQPFTTVLAYSGLKWLKYDLVWKKSLKTGFLNATHRPLRQHEDVLVFSRVGRTVYNPQGVIEIEIEKVRTGVKMRGNTGTNYGGANSVYAQRRTNYPSSVIEIPNSNRGVLHPTQKPVALIEYLIKTYSNAGDTVLDNCMGSGTTGVACRSTGRKFIGMELDAEMFAKAKYRILNGGE